MLIFPILLIVLGLAVGLISSIFGVGGGVVIVPTLYTIFEGIDAQIVIACSLGVIFVNSILNLRNFIKIGLKPNFYISGIVGFMTICGALLGTSIVANLDSLTIKKSFAYVLFGVVAKMIFFKQKKIESDEVQFNLNAMTVFKTCFIGLGGGLLASLTGLGGGAIMVPLFITILAIPMKYISVYSNAAMIFATGTGLVAHLLAENSSMPEKFESLNQFQIGHANYVVIFCIFCGAFITSKFGAKWGANLPAKKKKYTFAALLLFFGIRILIKS